MSVPPRARPASVAEYVAALPPESARVVKKVLALARKHVAGSNELISYGIPALSRGRVYMYCAAFKSHIGIYPPVKGDARLIERLKPYANPKGNLRFPLDEPIPYTLIARVAKALAKPVAVSTTRTRTKAKAKAYGH